jgi:hypothetical protein
LGIFANRFESEQQLQEWLISFYEEQLRLFLDDIGGITKHGVKITPTLIKITMHRYSQLMEKYDVTDWEQS